MVFVAFHVFSLHFVNDGNSGLWEALEATQDVRSAELKKPLQNLMNVVILFISKVNMSWFA